METKRTWLALGILMALTGLAAGETTAGIDCPVTKPNGEGYVRRNRIHLNHGNQWLATSLWPQGKASL